MISRSIFSCFVTSFLVVVAAPSAALGCNIAFREIGPVQIRASEVKRPSERSATRAGWHLDESWVGTRPELNQVIRVRGLGTIDGVSFSGQRALSIDAAAPADNGWLYRDDDLDSTPPCEITGLGAWQQPVILVREGRGEVRVAAAARPTPGSRAGCVLGGDDAVWGCPTLTRTIVKLSRPIGDRRIILETPR